MWTSENGFEYPCDKCGKYTNERELDYIRLTACVNIWFCVQCANEFDAVQHVIDNYNNPLPTKEVQDE